MRIAYGTSVVKLISDFSKRVGMTSTFLRSEKL